MSVQQYFSNLNLRKKVFNIRGKLSKTIEFTSARLFVKSLKKKMHVVAFRYEDEEKFRYICASKLTWRAEDIILSYGFRWLVGVPRKGNINLVGESPTAVNRLKTA